jgi:hypothetical protein
LLAIPEIKTFEVGVYFPERNPAVFVVKANLIDLQKDGTCSFYICDEFVASFTHVAWVIVNDSDDEKDQMSETK